MTKQFSDFPYQRITAEEFEDTAAQVVEEFTQAASGKEQINILKSWDNQMKKWESFATMAYIRFTQNTQDEERKAEREYYDGLYPTMVGGEQTLIREILSSPFREELESTFGANLFETWELSLTAFDPKIADEKRTEAELSAQYSALLAGLKIPFRGKEYTLSTLYPFYESADRSVRLEAKQAQAQALGEVQEELDQIYSKLVEIRHAMALKMGFTNYINLGYAQMGRVDYSAEDVAQFRQQIVDIVVPITQKIIASRAQRLALDDYNYADEGLMDAKGEISPKGDHDWMLEQAHNMFSEMGEDFDLFFSMMYQRNLLDLKSREGKQGGGYCTIFADQEAPFIFANFNGSQGDVRVFTHECGHAFQCFQSRNQAHRKMIWPTYEAAEIHSMSLEFLSYPWMEDFFKEDTERFKISHLEGALLFLPYGAAVDEFQHIIYEHPTLTPQERANIWKELEEKYLPHRKFTNMPHFESGRFWQRQGHIYTQPFYYIDYCLAQICALQFWTLAEEDREEAMKRYRHLCSLGGSLPFTALLDEIELLSPFSPGTIEKAVQVPLEYLDLN